MEKRRRDGAGLAIATERKDEKARLMSGGDNGLVKRSLQEGGSPQKRPFE